MCRVKTPKVENDQPATPVYLHNPFVDQSRGAFASRTGRNALRIRRGSGVKVGANGRLAGAPAPQGAASSLLIRTPAHPSLSASGVR